MCEEFTTWVDIGNHLPRKETRDTVERPADPNRPPPADGEGYDVDILSDVLDT
jgi:hypothetical protein